MNMTRSRKKALICGIRGQDGAYLAEFLISKNYEVLGTTRDVKRSDFSNLERLNILKSVRLITMIPTDFQSVYNVLERSQPDEVYFLSGQSSVSLSFENPVDTFESIVNGLLNMLEACRRTQHPIRVYNAGSGECFGNTYHTPADENTPFQPLSPYATAKASGYWLVNNYREAHNLWACTGLLFNHESPFRPTRYVTQKIVTAAKHIAAGSSEKLKLGRLDIARDWGWAPEYVDAMWRMLQQPSPKDYVIATGQTHTLQEFVEKSFEVFNLDWRDHVLISKDITRPVELVTGRANPYMAEKELGWKASYRIKDIVGMMV